MSFETKSLGPIGVEINGLDLTRSVSDVDFRSLRENVVREGLVLLRNQPIEAAQQIALGKRFGPIEKLGVNDPEEDMSMIVIGNVNAQGETFADEDPRMKLITINEGWHTDSSFRDVPASFSIFAAVTVPEAGGDTFYASLQRGWDMLPREEQRLLYGLQGIHDYSAAYRKRGNEVAEVVGFDMPQVEHPLVRTHPESGRAGLYVSEHIAGIAGMPVHESQALLERLLAITTREDSVYRHVWREGDLAIWDNRSMLHRAQGFDQRHPRVMHHVRVAGTEPPIATAIAAPIATPIKTPIKTRAGS